MKTKMYSIKAEVTKYELCYIPSSGIISFRSVGAKYREQKMLLILSDRNNMF